MPRRNAGTALLVGLLLSGLVGTSEGDVHDIGGDQAGIGSFEWTALFYTTGTYATFRLPTPTRWILGDRTNKCAPLSQSIHVWNADFSNANAHLVLDNDGYSNSVTYVQVINPAPGAPYQFWIYFDFQGSSSMDGFGLEDDIPARGFQTTYYTNPSAYIDAGNAQISSALSQALADTPSGTFAGNRGTAEKIALEVGKLNYTGKKTHGLATLASEVWAVRSGDCDDVTKLQCAMLRRAGIPARVQIAVNLGVPPDVMGAAADHVANFHALGEYWNGDDWESFEPHYFENFAGADNMLLGTDEDFVGLYPVKLDPPYSYPFVFVSDPTFTAANTHYGGGQGGFVEIDTRNIGPAAAEIAAQMVLRNGVHLDNDPSDILEPVGGQVTVDARGGAGVPRLLSMTNPSIGGISLVLAGELDPASAVEVVDLQGRVVLRREVGGSSGPHAVRIVDSRMHPGVYFVRLVSGRTRETLRCVYLGR